MASSPNDAAGIAAARDPQSLFNQSLRDIDDRLKRGEPFSGHERNCLFLNTGSSRWATVSHISGFDFEDDARALAATDWDGDGDVDVWAANRTAPMIRYLQNNTPRAGDFLSLKLIQDTGNRDAIGARVEIGLSGRDAKPLVREVRAGDGFLAQSSLRLHFGLGPKAVIASLTVRWPDGVSEPFRGALPNAAWILRRGSGKAVPGPARKPLRPLAAGALPAAPGEFPAVVPLAHSLPVPRLDFTTLTGEAGSLDRFRGSPLLVVLCSAGFEACRDQLTALSKQLPALRTAGLRVFAAGMDDGRATRDLLAGLPPDFDRGLLPASTRERLAHLSSLPFEIDLQLTAPSGFLFDSSLRFFTLYRGPVTPDQLMEGLKRAALTPQERITASLPFAGTWFRAPAPWAPLELLTTLLRQNDWAAADAFLTGNRAEFKASRRYETATRLVADTLINQDRTAAAIPHYRECLAAAPADPALLNNLAHCLIHQPGPDAAALAEAVTRAGEAVRLTAGRDPSLLDTLARALLASGRKSEARAAILKALALPSLAKELREGLNGMLPRTAP